MPEDKKKEIYPDGVVYDLYGQWTRITYGGVPYERQKDVPLPMARTGEVLDPEEVALMLGAHPFKPPQSPEGNDGHVPHGD